ncbi:apolipoprotein N-acyltransferase [Haliangium sp.]|uniref:apolipoprotein N-acyltransferase n=1 Tax=Haliangium sp. TaxID=2663208 RepID=UPI003D0EC70D
MTLWLRLALCALSGALAAMAFPSPGLWWLAFVAWAPLLVSVGRGGAQPGAACGAVGGVVFFAVLLRWLAPITLWGWLALVVWQALFVAIAGAMCSAFLRGPAVIRALVPVAWIATEWARGQLSLGFEWGSMGYALAPVPALAQLAAVGGVPLLSLALLSTNLALALAVEAALRDARRRVWHRVWIALLAAVVPVGALAAGGWLVPGPTLVGSVRVAVVNAAIDPHAKWADSGVWLAMTRHSSLTDSIAARAPDLILWPETAIPVPLEAPGSSLGLRKRALERRVAELWRAPLLVGVPAAVPGRPETFWNAVALVSPQGRTTIVHRKRHLVPFGEYTPHPSLGRVLPGPEFVPGDGGPATTVAGARIGTLICFDDVIPGEALERAEDADVLAVVTNDAWFGEAGAEQHHDIAVLRAIETRRSIARAANRGVSGAIDPYGHVIAADRRGPTALVVEVPRATGTTLYARAPAALPALSLGLLALALVSLRRRRRDPRPSP